MDIFRFLQLIWTIRFHILGFFHALLWIISFQYAVEVWYNGVTWFDFSFWMWIYTFVVTIIFTIQFDDDN